MPDHVTALFTSQHATYPSHASQEGKAKTTCRSLVGFLFLLPLPLFLTSSPSRRAHESTPRFFSFPRGAIPGVACDMRRRASGAGVLKITTWLVCEEEICNTDDPYPIRVPRSVCMHVHTLLGGASTSPKNPLTMTQPPTKTFFFSYRSLIRPHTHRLSPLRLASLTCLASHLTRGFHPRKYPTQPL